jgi:predicted DNA-binding transcriptional regulator AlpA
VPEDLVGVAEIAQMLDVSRQRVDRIIKSAADFPPPLAELSAGRIWEKAAVEEWLSKNPRRGPGRPPVEDPR